LLLAAGLAARLPLPRMWAFVSGLLLWSFVWFAFTALRGAGDGLGPAGDTANLVPTVERWLFGGQLPSARLQGWFYDPGRMHWYDWLFSGVYGSFFVVSSIVSTIAMAKHRPLFRTHVRVLALVLAIGCVVFALLPTNPPWMSADPGAGETIDRAGYHSLERFRDAVLGPPAAGAEGMIEDNNPLAAMPSIHLAATALLYLLARRFGSRPWQLVTLTYTVLMGVALVYLGEHFVLDVAAGLGLTLLSWRLVADASLRDRLAPVANLLRRRSVPPISPVNAPHATPVENVEDRAA
jgi:membrane-associated phospholipid phosphatase